MRPLTGLVPPLLTGAPYTHANQPHTVASRRKYREPDER